MSYDYYYPRPSSLIGDQHASSETDVSHWGPTHVSSETDMPHWRPTCLNKLKI